MIGEEFISRKPATLVEVKELLKARKKEKELTYEQEQTYKYASAFAKITLKQREKLFSELVKLDTVSDVLAVKIIDLMPGEIEAIKLIPDKSEGASEENLAKALEIIRKYIKKK